MKYEYLLQKYNLNIYSMILTSILGAVLKMGLQSKLPNNKIPHLNVKNWSRANRHLVGKILRELTHEKLITPLLQKQSDNDYHQYEYTLFIDKQCVRYHFSATYYQLNHLDIHPQTITKWVNNHEQPLDAIQLVIELKTCLGIMEKTLPCYLDEISSTLCGYAFKYHYNNLSAEQLIKANYQTVETSMSEGHPVFIANNGRIGFDAADYKKYAPESASPISLIWLAVHRKKTVFSSLSTLSYQELMEEELGNYLLEHFNQHLNSLNLLAQNYYFMPVHPWQWNEKITISFASDIANNDIVYLGQGHDNYLAQQSIRTFFNISNPYKNYVKTALSILNMGFIRGLSPQSMTITPQINEWISQLVAQDEFFQKTKFTVLLERAAIGYFNSHFECALINDSPHKKMLSALWRESPMPLLAKDQRLMTMASLLHIDNKGHSVVAALINSSGIDTAAWITCYLNVYLAPLIHAFFIYDLVFMPHGENLILVLENNVPAHVLMKDIGEEIAILNGSLKLPEAIEALHITVKDDIKINYILLDIFDCFFRHLTPLLQKDLAFSEQMFWQQVACCIYNWQSKHPEMIEKFKKFDLFKAEFVCTCLNKLQMTNNQQMIDLEDREKNLQFAGTLLNPLYAFKSEYSVIYK